MNIRIILISIVFALAHSKFQHLQANKDRREQKLKSLFDSPYYSNRSLGGYKVWEQDPYEGTRWTVEADGSYVFEMGDKQQQYVAADESQGWMQNFDGTKRREWTQVSEGVFEMKEEESGTTWTINFIEGTSRTEDADGYWVEKESDGENEKGWDSEGYGWETAGGSGELTNPNGEVLIRWTVNNNGIYKMKDYESGVETLWRRKQNSGWIKTDDGWSYHWKCDENQFCESNDSQGNYWVQESDGSEYVYYFDGSTYFFDSEEGEVFYYDNIFWYQFSFDTWEFKQSVEPPQHLISRGDRDF